MSKKKKSGRKEAIPQKLILATALIQLIQALVNLISKILE